MTVLLDCEGNASNAVCGTSREIPGEICGPHCLSFYTCHVDDEHNPVCNDSHVSVKSNVIPGKRTLRSLLYVFKHEFI